MLRSYLRASPSGAQAHRIPICYCINCMYCTVFTVYTVYCTHMIWVAARKESLLNQQSLQELCVIQVSSDVHRECFRMPRTRRFKRYHSLHVRNVHQLQVHRVMNQLALVSRIKVVNLRSQNAEQLRENGWLRCSRKPQSFKTYDSSEFGVHTPKNGTGSRAFLLYIIYCTVVLYVFWRASAPT